MTLFTMPTPTLIIGAFIILIAAIVRGFTGFGYSALSIAMLSFFYDTAVVVPTVLMMEIIASTQLMPSVWKEIDWKWLWPTLLGMVLGTPVGMTALTWLDPNTVRLILYSVILILALLAILQDRGVVRAFVAPVALVGFVAGVVNGLAGIAGLVLVLFILSTGRSSNKIRASLITFFFVSDIYALLWGGSMGLVGRQQIELLIIYLAPLALGVWVGHKLFERSGGKNYKNIALGLILFVALMGLGRVLITLL